MTKQEFVNEVARRSQLTARDAGKAVDAFLDTITDTLKSGGDVCLHRFRQVLEPAPRGSHRRQSAQPDGEGAHPGRAGSEVLGR